MRKYAFLQFRETIKIKDREIVQIILY